MSTFRMTRMIRSSVRDRRFRVVFGLILLAGFLIQADRALQTRPSEESSPVAVRGPARPVATEAIAAPSRNADLTIETLEERAGRDPVGFLEWCLERHDRSVRDYTCVFTKQERVGRRLTEVQVINAMFREKPFSVRLDWVENADKCDQVLYVEDRWYDGDARMAVVVPGRIARLFVPYVMRQIDGPDARKTSRRTIDHFGLRNSMLLILKYCHEAREKNIADYTFTYMGNGQVDGRDTLVFERFLPYNGQDSTWPDRILIVHIDRELLVPVLCKSYADDEREQLLGSYLLTDIRINVNLPDETFTMKGLGLE